jgi:hypothetical protein
MISWSVEINGNFALNWLFGMAPSSNIFSHLLFSWVQTNKAVRVCTFIRVSSGQIRSIIAVRFFPLPKHEVFSVKSN